jgi:hypothetical protein
VTAAAGWNWAAGPHSAGPQVPLGAASGRTVTWRRKGNHEGALTLTVTDDMPDDDEATQAIAAALTAIDPLITDVWITYRDPLTGVLQYLPRLRLGGRQIGGDARKLALQYGLLDYREVLHGRNIPPGKTVAWAHVNPVDALWVVLNEEQARPGSNLGIIRGLHQSLPAVDTLDVSVGDAVSAAIDKLASLVVAGCDWDITAMSFTALQLDTWSPSRGTDKGVTIALGGAATSMPTDTLDIASYANSVQGTGQAPSGGGSAPAPQVVDVADIATRPEGRWDKVASTDQTSAAAVLAATQRELADSQKLTPSRAITLARGWWRGPAHLWLGDPFTFVAEVGPLRIESTETVEEITADFSKPGDPAVSLTLGTVPRDARYRSIVVDRRLAALELRT